MNVDSIRVVSRGRLHAPHGGQRASILGTHILDTHILDTHTRVFRVGAWCECKSSSGSVGRHPPVRHDNVVVVVSEP